MGNLTLTRRLWGALCALSLVAGAQPVFAANARALLAGSFDEPPPAAEFAFAHELPFIAILAAILIAAALKRPKLLRPA